MKIKKNVHINEEIREIEAFYGWNTSISMSCNERYSVVLHPTLNFSFICLVTGWNILAFALLLCLWARQGLHCATRAVTRGHGFCNLFRRTAPFCHLVICMESRWSSVLRLNTPALISKGLAVLDISKYNDLHVVL